MDVNLRVHVVPLLLLLCVCDASNADIYKWIDESGQVQFGDKRPTGQSIERVEVKVNTYESVSYDTSIFDAGDKVIMYSTEWCGYCKKARKYFQANSIAFTEYDIEKNSHAKRRYEKLGARGVPVILVGKKRMNGFSVAGFNRIYQ